MRGILTGSRGMAPVALVIVIAAALLAVLFLTGTLIAARNIDRNVEQVITPTFSDTKGNVGAEAKFIDEARKTVRISGAIDDAAKDLSGHLDRTYTAARSIDRTAKSILTKAGPINNTVKDINGNVLAIGSTVRSIGGNVATIGGSVQSINRTVRGIGADANSIDQSVQEINASARSILENGRTILTRVRSIDPAVAGINGRAATAIGIVRPIASDLHSVLGLVGTNTGGQTILAHAASIDCSRLLNVLFSTTSCER